MRKPMAMMFGLIALLMVPCQGKGGPHEQGNASVFLTKGASGSIHYLIGGVGIEERAAMQAMAGDYNLKVVFSLKTGEYISNADLKILDGKGRIQLHIRLNGPWFMARLQPGNYSLVAIFQGRTKIKRIEVGKSTMNVFFQW